MAIVATASFEYIAGDDILLEFAVVDEDGLPVSILGDDIRFAICDPETHDVVLSSEGGSPIGPVVPSLTDPDYGLFEVEISGNDTGELLGTYEWQCKVDDVTPQTSTVGQGFITFSRTLLPAV